VPPAASAATWCWALGKGLAVAAVDRAAQGLAELAQAAQERQHGADLMTIEADLARDESIDEIVSKARRY
jgi:short-subunit dehydrogenase